MKKKKLVNFTRKMIAGCVAIAIAVSVIVINQSTSHASNGEIVYEEMDMSNYWSATKKNVPVKSGYVFGGWYESEDKVNYTVLKEKELEENGVPTVNVYAKFVPDKVLSVKTQMGTKGNKTSLRLLSSVDSTEYQYVGFMYQLGSGNVGNKKMDKVYSGIKLSQDGDEVVKPCDEFAEESKYFVAVNITNIASKNFETVIYARPYWITMDGTKVMGLARNNRVEDKVNDYISVPINLLSDGSQPVEIAAGKLTMVYDATKVTVAKDDDNYKVDTGKLLTEMEYKVEEINGVGTITFVGNAANVKADVLAEGLFANVRFQKLDQDSTITVDDINVEKTANQFCDWDENLKTVDVR